MSAHDDPGARVPSAMPRRRVLCAALVATIGGALTSRALAATDPSKLPPATGDQLAFGSWENDGRLVSIADVLAGAPPLTVYPRDGASGVTREKSRLNQILLLRLDPAILTEATRAYAIEGVLAYSAICTHAACGVSEWNAANRHLICPCHSSEYDPAAGAARITGPAIRPLPALPLKRDDDKLVIAGPFSAAVGGNAQ